MSQFAICRFTICWFAIHGFVIGDNLRLGDDYHCHVVNRAYGKTAYGELAHMANRQMAK